MTHPHIKHCIKCNKVITGRGIKYCTKCNSIVIRVNNAKYSKYKFIQNMNDEEIFKWYSN